MSGLCRYPAGPIRACYLTSSTSAPQTLKRVPASASCPKGYSSLTWNKQGPFGPAVNASIMLTVAQGDTVARVLADDGAEVGEFGTVGPVANMTYETVSLTAALPLLAGDALTADCSDYTSNASTSFS
jgi:hypothetical protein